MPLSGAVVFACSSSCCRGFLGFAEKLWLPSWLHQTEPGVDNTLRARTRKALQEGLELDQQGDYESSFFFDAENKQHARLAIRLIGCKRKRRAKLSPNFLAARKRSQFKSRTVQEGPERPQTEPIPVLAGV